jgi:hypothetical protein
MRGMYFSISSAPQDYSVLIKREMISGASESAELGRHGQCQVRKHVGKIFVLISCNLFVLAVPYFLLDFFSMLALRFKVKKKLWLLFMLCLCFNSSS